MKIPPSYPIIPLYPPPSSLWKKLHWFCVASLCDWPGKLAKSAQTVKSNFKGNHDLVTSVFASVQQITFLFSYRISFYFVLIRAMIRQGDLLHSPPRCDWSKRLAPPSSALWLVKETRSTILRAKNTKTNQDLIARVFLGFGQFAWFNFELSWLFVVITLVLGLRYSIEKCCPFYGTD